MYALCIQVAYLTPQTAWSGRTNPKPSSPNHGLGSQIGRLLFCCCNLGNSSLIRLHTNAGCRRRTFTDRFLTGHLKSLFQLCLCSLRQGGCITACSMVVVGGLPMSSKPPEHHFFSYTRAFPRSHLDRVLGSIGRCC